MLNNILFFLTAVLLSGLFTYFLIKWARKIKIFDLPNEERKRHGRPVPLLGGLAIFLSFWLVTGIVFLSTDLLHKHFSARQLFFVFFASALLMLVGFYDDKYKMRADKRLLFTALCVGVVLLGGINFDGVTNPFGGTIGLDFWKINLGFFGQFLVGVNILVFLWLTGMMYTVKILDGLDGLAVGVVGIAALMVFALSQFTKFFQPDTALVALILAGACLGFLIFNFYPAKIFLGEGGGLFLGLMVGVLATIAGGKIATTLLVMAVPIIDLAWVIIIRALKHQNILKGDRLHLHFQLVDIGWSHRQAVLLLYSFSLLFGVCTLFFSSFYKLLALVVLSVLVVIVEVVVRTRK